MFRDSLVNSFLLFVELCDPPYLYMCYIYSSYSSFTINDNFHSYYVFPYFVLFAWMASSLARLLYLRLFGRHKRLYVRCRDMHLSFSLQDSCGPETVHAILIMN